MMNNNKNIGVFCFLEFENKLLLVKKNYDNKSWTLPGGSINIGEGIQEALIREVNEETGQTLKHVDFVAAFYSKEHYSIGLCFQSKLMVLEKISFNPIEISQAGLFRLDNLPKPMSPRYSFWIQSFRQLMRNRPENLFVFD